MVWTVIGLNGLIPFYIWMSVLESKGRIHQQFYRNGPSHRDGADVSFQDIRKLFNFATITVGRWVTAEEQQIAANLFTS